MVIFKSDIMAKQTLKGSSAPHQGASIPWVKPPQRLVGRTRSRLRLPTVGYREIHWIFH